MDNKKRKKKILIEKTVKFSLCIIVMMLIIFVFEGKFTNENTNQNTNKDTSKSENYEANNLQNNTNEHTNYEEPEIKQAILDIPVIEQLPELYNGCEVTSLTMLLNSKGIDVGKMELAENIKKDTTPLYTEGTNIISWGDPREGFVGDVTGGNTIGYGVYNKPLLELLNKYYKDKGIDLTGEDFSALENQINNGHAVVTWVTADFSQSSGNTYWYHEGEKVNIDFNEHCVLMVGYDENNVYINDPLSGGEGQAIDKLQFINAWKSMGSMAISCK